MKLKFPFKLWIGLFGFILFQATLSPNHLNAQKLTTVCNPTTVGVGEYIEISFQLEGADANIGLPSLNDFDVVQGPTKSSNYSWVNGKSSQSISVGFILQAKKIGKFTIKPAFASINGQNIFSNPVSITVNAGSGNTAGGNKNQGRNGQNGREVSGDESNRNEYFIKASLDKNNVYQGEPITITYAFYLRNSGLENLQVKKMPSFNGFWVKDIPSAVDKDFHEEVVGGKKYLVAVLKKAVIYPQKSGNLSADVMTADAVITRRATRRQPNNDPFSAFFDDVFEGTESFRKTLISEPLTIKVKPLPEQGRPEPFSGLVGSFSGNSTINKSKIKENEALTILYSISGNGNIQEAQAPTLNLPPDWDVYDPKTLEKNGQKIFEYTIVPKKQGNYDIQTPDISYFDINSRSYRFIKGKTFKVEVEKGTGNNAGSSILSTSNSKQDVKLLKQDILFNSSNISLSKEKEPFFGSPLFYGLTMGPIISMFLIGFFAKKSEENNADTIQNRQKKSGDVAKKALKTAEKLKNENKSDAFYEEIINAVYTFFKNNTGLENSELNNDIIREELKRKNVSDETIKSIIRLLDDALFARYAPSLGAKNMDTAYSSASEVITNLSQIYKV